MTLCRACAARGQVIGRGVVSRGVVSLQNILAFKILTFRSPFKFNDLTIYQRLEPAGKDARAKVAAWRLSL